MARSHRPVFASLAVLLVVAVGCVLAAQLPRRPGPNIAAFGRLNPLFGAPVPVEIRQPRTMPAGWAVDGERPVRETELVTLTFAIKQRNLDVLEKMFWAVSTPSSPEYGRFLSFEQIADLVRPDSEAVSILRDWLQSNGIDFARQRLSVSGDWLQVDVSVAEAQELLQCRFIAFRHISASNIRIVRSLVPYYVPALV